MDEKFEKIYTLSEMLVHLSDSAASIMLHGFTPQELRKLPKDNWQVKTEKRPDGGLYLVVSRGNLTLFSDTFGKNTVVDD